MNSISLSFKGKTYSISDDQAFQAGEVVEDIVTLPELARWGDAPKFFKLSRCFGAMLRFAGCKVSDRDVHAEMMAQVKSGGEDQQELLAAQAVGALIAVLMNGAPEDDGEGEVPEKPKASSKPRSKRR